MISRRSQISAALLLLATLLLVPQSQIAQEYAINTGKVSPKVREQVGQADTNELITVIVKMAGQTSLRRVDGQRAPVFSALRQTAAQSQSGLVNTLTSPDRAGKVGVVRQFWIDNLVLVQATKDVIAEIAGRKDVIGLYDNFIISLPPRPHPSKNDLDRLRRADAQIQPQLWDNIAKVGAKDVWSTYGFDGTGVRVGGLDTGVDITHPDIAGKMHTTDPSDPTYPGGWAELDGNGNLVEGSVPYDSQTHGTHTTGTMIGGNASGYDIGVAPGATLMHGMVIPGGSGTFAQIIGGMEWIIDPDGDPSTDDGAQVVNMSLGAGGAHELMIAPVDNMVAAGVFPSFSIGNSGPDPGTSGSPGNVPSAFATGATDSTDAIASFSSRGPVEWNYPPYVGTYTKPDISAPGVQIYSSVSGGLWQYTSSSGPWNGTSMATPHVSGTVALMLQAKPDLAVETIKQLLAETAIDRGQSGKDNAYGYGRLDAFMAVTAAMDGVGTLSGTVNSSAAGPVADALVHVTDTGQKVRTDQDGKYSLQLVAGVHYVEFSDYAYKTRTVPLNVAANTTTTRNVTLTLLPSGTVAGFLTDAATGEGIRANVAVLHGGAVVKSTTADPITGGYSVLLPVGTYHIRFEAPFPFATTTEVGAEVTEGVTTTLNVAIDPAEILIVADDGPTNYELYYQNAIAASGRKYITIHRMPRAEEMAMFESVVWFTGDDYWTTLTSLEINELMQFLDGGGRLFISGQDIGYNIGPHPFYGDYLHADFVVDISNTGGVLGVPTSPIGAGFAFNIKAGSGANNQEYPDEVNPIAPAQTAFVYDEMVPAATAASSRTRDQAPEKAGGIRSRSAGLAVDTGVFKVVYFSFGFEGIADADTRDLVMSRVLDWLLGYPVIDHEPMPDTEDTDNAYRATAIVTSESFQLDPSTFALVYDAGSGPLTVPMSATGLPDQYEALIPPQPRETTVEYYISAADAEGHASTNPFGAPRFVHSFEVGKDTERPVIDHAEYLYTNDIAGPYRIEMLVTDNGEVGEAYLIYTKNDESSRRVKMTRESDGGWAGSISGPSVVGDVYRYYMIATDASYSGNATRSPETGSYQFEIIEEFVWDFEEEDGNFAPSGLEWQWGAPTSGPAAAHSGNNVWATNLAGDHEASMDARLDIPPVTIDAGKRYALLTFWHWYEFETYLDGGNVKISTDDGATWEIITPVGGYDGIIAGWNPGIFDEPAFTGYDNKFWQEVTFDLSSYAGETVIIRLHAGSGFYLHNAGWYIDDIRLRSTDVDDVAPVIHEVAGPASTLDEAGPYAVTATVTDVLSGLAEVSAVYSSDGGGSWTELAMAGTGDDEYSGDIPGQPAGTRLMMYIRATDNGGSETVSPAAGKYHHFSILPSAPILVMVSATTGASLEDFRLALEANEHQADYWNLATQGDDVLDLLPQYEKLIVDEASSISAVELDAYTAYLQSGSVGNKKGFFLLGRDVSWTPAVRPWIAEWFRADYVQDDPAFREITGASDDPIGAGETFVISGAFPDEVRRSSAHQGGEVVYRFSAQGTQALDAGEAAAAYAGLGKEWDGVVPRAPKSLDAAAGIRYNADTYRSVLFTFNFDYVQEAERRAGIAHRVIRWLEAPEIVHEPLRDTEDPLAPNTVTARVYADKLDASRTRLVYDSGSGPVTVDMTPTANPDEYAADIPAQPLNTTVGYYISASNTDGNTSFLPAGAPTNNFTFRVTADVLPPQIVHTPEGTTADLAGPYLISAVVTDNAGVDPDGVALTYRKNGGASTTVAMLGDGGDVYTGEIPGPSVLGDVYEYYIEASDIAGATNTARDPQSGYHTLEIVDFFAWDFEADGGGFTATGQDWEWGSPAAGPGGAHSGQNVWATKLEGDYSSPSNSTIDSPALVVPDGAAYAQLRFWQWYDIETNYDGGNVKLSTDGGTTWVILTPETGYTGTARGGNAGIPNEPCFTGTAHQLWHEVTFDLTPYKGQAVVLRWHFGSDSSVDYAGWYIDDVRVESTGDVKAPAIDIVNVPGSAYDAEGPYTVTARVVDIHSGVESATVHYSVDGGDEWTAVEMAATGEADQYSAKISGQSEGTRIHLYIEAVDKKSNTVGTKSDVDRETYQFGVVPSADFLVLTGGEAHTDPSLYRHAFGDAGKAADFWDWDDLGMPTAELLESYRLVVIDLGGQLDQDQEDFVAAWLDREDGTAQKVLVWGRDLDGHDSDSGFMERYAGARPGKELVQSPSLSTRLETDQESREFHEKYGEQWKQHLSSAALIDAAGYEGVRYLGPNHASVFVAYNFGDIADGARRSLMLDRSLAWLAEASPENQTTGHGGGVTTPDRLTMDQNYPNPFNPTTTLKVGVPDGIQSDVSLKIYNVRGQLVRTLLEGSKAPGWYTYLWDGRNDRGATVSTGVYFARFDDTKTVLTRKMVLLK